MICNSDYSPVPNPPRVSFTKIYECYSSTTQNTAIKILDNNFFRISIQNNFLVIFQPWFSNIRKPWA